MKVIPNFEKLTKSLPKSNGEVEFHYTSGNQRDMEGNEYPKTYWSDLGFYQYQYDELCGLLIPPMNEAETIQGEMLRCISRLYYDFCNNGNCNVIEQETEMCSECMGSGMEDEEECSQCQGECYYDEDLPCHNCNGTGMEEQQDCSQCGGECYVHSENKIDSFYEDMLFFLETHLDSQGELIELREFLEDDSRIELDYDFTKKEMRIYDRVVDQVVWQILQSPMLTPNPNYKPVKVAQ